jgi:hypothetical protein
MSTHAHVLSSKDAITYSAGAQHSYPTRGTIFDRLEKADQDLPPPAVPEKADYHFHLWAMHLSIQIATSDPPGKTYMNKSYAA